MPMPLSLLIRTLVSFVTLLYLGTPQLQAHEADEHCEAISASVTDAGFGDVVSVECVDGQALISGDTYPNHVMMDGIVGSNEQVPVPAKDYVSPLPLQPAVGTEPQTRDAALGVAVNGVPIYDYTAGGEMSIDDLSHHQTQHDTVITEQLDICGGHAGRGDDYHYHAAPVCMMAQMANAGFDAIIGWGFDGFPIYGNRNPDGSLIALGDLDVCNGQTDNVFGYRYHTSVEAPYIIQCLMGEVPDFDSLPRVPPLQPADGSPGPEAGFPPGGGVEDLTFTQSDSGQRRMTYDYKGENYYINYRPSGTDNCYNFETRTVTNGGVLYEQELCRGAADSANPADRPADAKPRDNLTGRPARRDEFGW